MSIDNPKELIQLINECLKPKQKEKQENGEVFTPIHIIDEMLDNLNEHYKSLNNGKSIFANGKLRWFDPAVGMGNFMVVVYLRLMNELADEFEDETERKNHILKNMLYMSEINKKNVFICKQVFGNSNIYEGDTLKLDVKEKWDVNKFDVIVGNPPYNKGGIRSHTGKQLGEKNETIWTNFIELSFKILKDNGYLVFINPLSWLKKSHSLHDDMLFKNIVWLKLWDNSQSKNEINADIPISLYVLYNKQNTTLNKSTKITSVLKRRNLISYSDTYLNPKYSIPLAYHSIFNKILKYIEENDLKLHYKTKTVKSEGKKFNIPEQYEITGTLCDDMLAVDTYTIKEGIMVKKLIEKHPDTNKRKLVIANKASFKGSFIDQGKLGLTGNHKFYILGNNLELIQKILNFKLGEVISHFTKYGQDFLDRDAFNYIPDLRKLGISDITELEFYKLLNLSDDEIHLIGYNQYKTISYDDKTYYLIDNQLFKINKDKSKGDLIGERTVEENIYGEIIEFIILY